MIILLLSIAGSPQQDESRTRSSEYRSPYTVEFTIQHEELVHDLDQTARGNPHLQSEIPFAEWYSHRTRERWHGWGPTARHYPPPTGIEHRTPQWKRERVIAVGLRFLGYEYQHHHLPDWNPPADWPWKATAIGHNGKGVDCSNFTGFVYNLGLGLRISTDVHRQAESQSASVSTHRHPLPVQRIALPDDYADRVRTLRTGDLLFVRDGKGEHISHVVLWVGEIGRSADDMPLVLDSHGEGVRDSDGNSIPAGIQLRPYRKSSWYCRQSSHALRLIVDTD